MAEWFKAHAWRACIRQKRIEGSNPSLSAGGAPTYGSVRCLRYGITSSDCSGIDDPRQSGVDGPTFHIQLVDDPNARAVVLVLERIRLERREFFLFQQWVKVP